MGDRTPSLCPRFHAAVELIGRRWTGAVIQVLFQGRTRYALLKSSVPDISDRMLSERLRELEAEGILSRIVTPDTPVRVEYELTRKGRALHNALEAIGDWAHQWIPLAPAPSREPKATGARAARKRKSA